MNFLKLVIFLTTVAMANAYVYKEVFECIDGPFQRMRQAYKDKENLKMDDRRMAIVAQHNFKPFTAENHFRNAAMLGKMIINIGDLEAVGLEINVVANDQCEYFEKFATCVTLLPDELMQDKALFLGLGKYGTEFLLQLEYTKDKEKKAALVLPEAKGEWVNTVLKMGFGAAGGFGTLECEEHIHKLNKDLEKRKEPQCNIDTCSKIFSKIPFMNSNSFSMISLVATSVIVAFQL